MVPEIEATATKRPTSKHAANSFPNSEKCYAQTINSFVVDQFQYRNRKKNTSPSMHFNVACVQCRRVYTLQSTVYILYSWVDVFENMGVSFAPV